MALPVYASRPPRRACAPLATVPAAVCGSAVCCLIPPPSAPGAAAAPISLRPRRPRFASPGGRLSPPHPPQISLTGGYGAGPQVGGGIAISGVPAGHAFLNATYAPTGELVAGYPSFSAGPKKHLLRHPGLDQWHLSAEPFDPASAACVAWIPAVRGPVPTGARTWTVALGGAKWGEAEVTAREVA